MSCSSGNCNGIDVFPLLKKSNCDGGGATGPTGPRGPRGANGAGGATNYLSIVNTENTSVSGTLAAPQSLPFNTVFTNKGWNFTASSGQSAFTVPVTGTYQVTFNVQFIIQGNIPAAAGTGIGGWATSASIYLNNLPVPVDRKYHARSGITNFQLENSLAIIDETSIYLSVMGDLTVGDILEFKVGKSLNNITGEPDTIVPVNNVSIQRIA